MKVLVVVDMQNDFIDGSLGTKEAAGIVPAVVDKIRHWDGIIIATRDTHPKNYLDTQEGRFLPVDHCIEGTEGWAIVAAALEEKSATIINKPTFGSTMLAEMLRGEEVEEIELIGLCTDICVVSNALLLKANMPEVPIAVDATCCAGVTPAKHDMRSCQITINSNR